MDMFRDMPVEEPDNIPCVVHFRYEPLDPTKREIRLVTLPPRGELGTQLHFNLSVARLTSKLKFEALSYTWGEDTRQREILLDGKPFMVSENLWLALQELPLLTEARVLWIDFICINQNDVYEKNHQVKKMGEIYSSASRVVAWLGEADEFSDPLFTSLNKPDFQDGSSKNSTGDEVTWVKYWAEKLNGRNYWTRLWIIQELGLASEILVACGSKSVDWKYLHPWFGKGSLTHRLNVLRKNRQSGQCTLLQLLKDFGDSNCKDPKDLVYGFLGLATDPSIDKLPIDYSKSLMQMYADLMIWANRKDKSGIASFSEQVQGVLSPFYNESNLPAWYRSSSNKGRMITLNGKFVGCWTEITDIPSKYSVQTPTAVRLYAIEAKSHWKYQNGLQPKILIAAQHASTLKPAEVNIHLKDLNSDITDEDLVYQFQNCDFSLVLQAERKGTSLFGRGFIARSPLPSPATPLFAIETDWDVQPTQKGSEPSNTYLCPIRIEHPRFETYPVTRFEMDVCSFQLLTNQQRPTRRSN